ncbi:MAG: D-glycero-beta-D-manno-heptose 1-phosphate adenylyltransferase [Alphaproteobacteria bacterium]|nr:D-glycero-beta-D-manno-heptose 1-phosphate adenylyltransferase [Alphaproteobacteria bacterium]
MNNSPAMLQLLDRFRAGRVACLGDLMLDRYVYGEVDRVSAEAPIPIIRAERNDAMLGGVGNVARNVAAAGGQAHLLAVRGEDGAGREVTEQIAAMPCVAADLVPCPDRSTTLKTRYIAAGQQLLRADRETTTPIDGAAADALLSHLDAALAQTDVLVLSDYGKGVLSDQMLAEAIARARAAKVPIIADPKRRDLTAYSGVDFLKPNRAELAAATGLPCGDDEQIALAAHTVMDHCEIGAMLVSRSEQGMSLIPRDGAPVHLPVRAPEVFDVSGAGDTVVAIFALALAAGAAPELGARLANLAAAVVVGKVGTAAVSSDELAAAVLSDDLTRSEDKVVSAAMAQADAERWRAGGLRIGFTNGCFDLLHPGHISLLNEAKSHCDRLIVAINDDASVRRLEKGEGRPVQAEAARALVLASLAMVDRVLIFADDTPIPLLRQLRPDVLIKGGDYDIAGVVGGDIVQAYGGEVKLARFLDGHSSTAVISRMDAGEAGSRRGN